MWRCYLGDTLSGAIGEPIDIPAMTWTLSIADASMSTTRDKGVGGIEAGGLDLPWSAVPGSDAPARQRALATYRRSIFLMWEDALGRTPVVCGAIGPRVDGWLDTSFELVSMMNLLGQRIVCPEGAFGNGSPAGTTTADVELRGLSLRGIASAIGEIATGAKPGGELPIDWTYLGERGNHQRTYYGFNAQNNSFAKLLDAITNVQGGPDAQLRPYITADGAHVRHRLVMGTDAHPALDQTGLVQTLTCFPGGGTIEDVRVAHTAPTMRVYGYGAGQDKAKLTYMAEDRALVTRPDPWPLVEEARGFTDDETSALVRSHAEAHLKAGARPLAQITGAIWLDDPATPGLAELWPGQMVDLASEGHPGLPDGVRRLRVMEMAGDETSRVEVTFDPIIDPWEA